ncbi:protein of unknown function [Hyphomicrobium sp. MC1]|nr:protein of unknown function [Hyphomicrobium sp. MC1]
MRPTAAPSGLAPGSSDEQTATVPDGAPGTAAEVSESSEWHFLKSSGEEEADSSRLSVVIATKVCRQNGKGNYRFVVPSISSKLTDRRKHAHRRHRSLQHSRCGATRAERRQTRALTTSRSRLNSEATD